MATILCIETATTNCSVALSVNGGVIALKEDNPTNKEGKKFSHAEKLHVYIKEVLSKAEISKHQIDAVAISMGPGSYTGLRIGVSAAKGLCYALDIPMISVSTLKSLSLQVKSTLFSIPMLDARRMEVYTAVFDVNGKQESKTEAKILDDSSYATFLDQGKVTFIGDGVTKFQEICSHPNAVFNTTALPSAKDMALIAEEKYKKNDIENVAYFEPYYLKDFLTN